MDNGRSNADSPFHKGEQEIHERLGIRDRMEIIGWRVIRDYIPDEHREFFGMLPFLLIGAVDDQGRPWASVITGRPGFLVTPDPRTLDIRARPLFGDPLNAMLKPGSDLAVLGIQPATRRRNRLTGRIASVQPDGFVVSVVQSFGNCPRYIQTRDIMVLPSIDAPERPRPVTRSCRFDASTRALIERSDTLFVATSYSDGLGTPSRGTDVSHRGGTPGFVRVENDHTFVFPDFAGNHHFNTVGNISLNPRVGFLFIDFDTGDLLYLTGNADVTWDSNELRAYVGAERLIRFYLGELIRVEGSLPLRFTFGDYSPALDHTGSWQQVDATITPALTRSDVVHTRAGSFGSRVIAR